MIKKLIDDLDRIFSCYVKLRHSKSDVTSCCTCGKPMFIFKQTTHAGHFVGRQHKSVRWHSMNVHPQCVNCNKWGEGMKAEYQKFIDKKYGYGKADELTVAGKQVKKWSTFELALLKETYVKEIEKHLIGRPDKVVNWAERIVRKYG